MVRYMLSCELKRSCRGELTGRGRTSAMLAGGEAVLPEMGREMYVRDGL